MPAYMIADVEVTDPVKFEEYKRLSAAAAALFGGKYVARGGQVEPLEGGWTPTRLVVIEFPNMEQARAWYDSPEYTHAREVRQSCARGRLIIVDGVAKPV